MPPEGSSLRLSISCANLWRIASVAAALAICCCKIEAGDCRAIVEGADDGAFS